MDGLTALSATELSAAIHGRKVSCRSVMEAYLARIGAINPLVNAIVSLRDEGELIAEAEAADRALAEGRSRGFPGPPRGP